MDAETKDIVVEKFIDTIPNKDRGLAIAGAKRSLDNILMTNWREEFSLLPMSFVNNHHLTPTLDGWEKYLKACFSQSNDFQTRFGFEDWSKKYLAQMLNTKGYDKVWLSEFSTPRIKPDQSYMDYFFSGKGNNTEIWGSQSEILDPNSLLVHSIDPENLELAINSGVVGRDGYSALAMCNNRVVYDRGYIIAWQAKDLIKVGYPLLRITEDFRDSEILNEWRSATPVDINLARLIVPTSKIPDRENASRAQIATSYFGVNFLKDIPRI